jgi:Bacterial low temperature requirement A protein (LtrA)
MATEEVESPKPKPSAHFSTADNLEYEIPADDNNDASTGRRRRSSSHHPMRSSILTQNYDISYHPDKLILFSRPRQRQKWGDTQVLPRVNYGDLFFDLFFVGAAYNTGNVLVEEPSYRGLLYFLAMFFPMMGLWLEKSFYDSRFVVVEEDVFHRIFELAVLVALAAAVLHIRPVDIMSNGKENVDTFAFCLSVFIGQALNEWRYLEVYFFGIGQTVIKEEAKRHWKMGAIYFITVLIATVLAGIEHYGSRSEEEETKQYESQADAYDYDTRNLAGSTASSYTTSHAEYDLPVYLILAAYVLRWLHMAVDIMFFFPSGGKHKER